MDEILRKYAREACRAGQAFELAQTTLSELDDSQLKKLIAVMHREIRKRKILPDSDDLAERWVKLMACLCQTDSSAEHVPNCIERDGLDASINSLNAENAYPWCIERRSDFDVLVNEYEGQLISLVRDPLNDWTVVYVLSDVLGEEHKEHSND